MTDSIGWEICIICNQAASRGSRNIFDPRTTVSDRSGVALADMLMHILEQELSAACGPTAKICGTCFKSVQGLAEMEADVIQERKKIRDRFDDSCRINNFGLRALTGKEHHDHTYSLGQSHSPEAKTTEPPVGAELNPEITNESLLSELLYGPSQREENRPYRCDVCRQSFRLANEYVKHLNEAHVADEGSIEVQMFSLSVGDYESKKEVEAQVQEELREIAAPKTTLPELTPEMKEKIAWALKPGTEILSEGYKVTILRKDVMTLKGLTWLNDEVINFYLSMVGDRGGTDGLPKAYAFSTFFYPTLLSGGHASLKRWTRNTDIFYYDLIIIPVHLGMHWCLAVVDFRDKAVRYFDSMGGHNDHCLQAILRYLVDESVDKKKVLFDTSDWRLINVPDIPLQGNGSDCGMFACKYAEYVSRDAQITFSQEDMPYFRKRMVYEILTRKLISP